MIPVVVDAIPVTEGSTKAFIVNGKPNVVHDNAEALDRWRDLIAWHTRAAMAKYRTDKIDGPVVVQAIFYLPRPASHYGTGRNAGVLKPSAPAYPDRKPDVDKLARAVLDALAMGGAYTQDSRVTDLSSFKRYADNRVPGAVIQFEEITDA